MLVYKCYFCRQGKYKVDFCTMYMIMYLYLIMYLIMYLNMYMYLYLNMITVVIYKEYAPSA